MTPVETYSRLTTQHQRLHESALVTRLSSLHSSLARDMTSERFLEQYIRSLGSLTVPMARLFRSHGREVGGFSLRTMIDFMGVKSTESRAREALERHLSQHSTAEASAITSRLTERMSNAIADGVSPAQALTDLRSVLKSPFRLSRIARTEIHAAAERGAWEAANSLGIRVGKYWWSRHDLKVRPDHALADGQLQEVDGLFTVGGQNLLYPGDTRASAKQVVNCRCTATYHLYVNGELQR